MSKILAPISKLNSREPKITGSVNVKQTVVK